MFPRADFAEYRKRTFIIPMYNPKMMPNIAIRDPHGILDRLKTLRFDNVKLYRFNKMAHKLSLVASEEELIGLEHSRNLDILPHQVNTALKVLNQYSVRGILADEVGLGKTIETGIVIKELIMRGHVNRCLILSPASLVSQWQGELLDKFNENFITAEDEGFDGFDSHDFVIASIDTAKSRANLHEIRMRPWDLLVVDEAHYLKNPKTARHKAISSIQCMYLLLLTATPLQNSLYELYTLSELSRPGLLGTMQRFRDEHVGDRKGQVLINPSELEQKLRNVMIRNRRSDTGIQFVERKVDTQLLKGMEGELELYRKTGEFIKREYEGGSHKLVLIQYQRMLCSSHFALRHALEKRLKEGRAVNPGLVRELLHLCETIGEGAKIRFLRKLIEHLDDKLIIFTQFIETQKHIAKVVSEMGIVPSIFNGSMSLAEKDKAVEYFRSEGSDVLVCTDSGAEGRNLQFAHLLLNYDLPWNPMKVEQRIGRIHRIGQKHDAVVMNIGVQDTIDAYIMETLYRKIGLFEVAVGEMDLVLSQAHMSLGFEDKLFEVIIEAKDERDLQYRLDLLSQDIDKAKKLVAKVRTFHQKTFSSFNLSVLEEVGG